MSRYSLKNLLLEVDTFVGSPDAGDRYVYRRKDDGWYTRNKEWPDSRPWALLDPRRPNFVKAIEKLNAAYPALALPLGNAASKTSSSVPDVVRSKDTIPSQKHSGDALKKKQVLALEEIAIKKSSPLDPEDFEVRSNFRALYAVQFILGVKQTPSFTQETVDAIKDFQIKNKIFSDQPLYDFGEDNRLGIVEWKTARALLRVSKDAATLSTITTYYGGGQYPVTASATKIPGLEVMDGIESKGVKINLRLDAVSETATRPISICAQTKCATYVADVFQTEPFRNESGDAWMQHTIRQVESGVIKISGFANLTDEDVQQVTKAFRLAFNKYAGKIMSTPDISAIVKTFIPDQSDVASKIVLGDIVGMYVESSPHFAEAISAAGAKFFLSPKSDADSQQLSPQPTTADLGGDTQWMPGSTLTQKRIGFGMNTHLGVVGAIYNNVPIVFHNIGGIVYATPVTADSKYPIMWVKTPQKQLNAQMKPKGV